MRVSYMYISILYMLMTLRFDSERFVCAFSLICLMLIYVRASALRVCVSVVCVCLLGCYYLYLSLLCLYEYIHIYTICAIVVFAVIIPYMGMRWN